MERLKRVVVKEEFVKLTGDLKKAIVLNQLLYWSERVKDFDSFIREENKRMNNNDIDDKPMPLQSGWIYKTAEELSIETMLGVSKQTMGRLLDDLCSNKWIDKRRNPKYKWDKTYQYRVNLIKISKDLYKLGYLLQDYKININNLIPSSKMELQAIKMELCNDKNGTAIPEITTEITNHNKGNETELSFECLIEDYNLSNIEYIDSAIEVVKYYLSEYECIFERKHIGYSVSSWIDILEGIFEHGTHGDTDVDVLKAAIDKHFTTEYKHKAMYYLHNFTGKTKNNRLYEAGVLCS